MEDQSFNPHRFNVLGLQMNPDYLEPGTHVAYFYKGKIHVGVTETGLNDGEGKFTVRNLATGKIQYPYTSEVIIPESPAAAVSTQFDLKPLILP